MKYETKMAMLAAATVTMFTISSPIIYLLFNTVIYGNNHLSKSPE